MLACSFADWKTAETREAIGVVAAQLKAQGCLDDILLTCHRVEHYHPRGKNGTLSAEGLDVRLGEVTSTADVFARLARIAVGAESEILGEAAIRLQVAAFLDRNVRSTRVNDATRRALSFADARRDEYAFRGPDHATLALQCVCRETGAKELLVVGSGMVALGLANRSRSLGFTGITIGTSNVRRTNRGVPREFSGHVLPIDVMLNSNPDQAAVLIATGQMDESMASSIRTFASKAEPSKVVDVCGVPVLSPDDGYITLVSQKMRELVSAHNEGMSDTTTKIIVEIENAKAEIAKELEEGWR